MSNKNQSNIHVFHPDILNTEDNATVEYFKKHEATDNYRNNFPDIEGDETTIYLYIKEMLINTFEAMWQYAQENVEKLDNTPAIKEGLRESFEAIKKLHVVEDDFLNHLELSSILWIHGKDNGQDISNLQLALDNKFIPKTDPKKNKAKAPSFVKSLSASMAYFLKEKGVSSRQSTLISADFFDLSHSLINKIMPDIREAYQEEYLEAILPVKMLAWGFILAYLYEHIERIKRIISENQDQKTNKKKREHFNQTYNAFEMLVKEKIHEFSDLFSKSELNHVTEIVKNDPDTRITTLMIENDDDIEALISKASTLGSAHLIKIFHPEPLEKIILD